VTLDEPGLSGTSEDSSAPSKPPVERPSRCPKGGQAISLGGVGARDEIEIGDGLEYAGGYAVAFAHREGAVRKAGVAFFGPEAEGTAHVTDLGVVADDAPAPLLARRSGDVLATVYRAPSGHASADPTRELTVYVVSRDHAASQGSFVKKADDSTVSDIASDGRDAFVVWDETSPTTVGAQGPGRGVIRGAPVIQTEPGAPARDLSPAESDAEAPRVVPSAAGYSVLWIARGGVEAPPPDAAEVTGEARVFTWLQRLDVDARGVARGPTRDLTPRGGHVAAYDARAFGDSLVIMARDDGEATDGSGGSLLRIRSRGGESESATALPLDGMGRGAPTFVDGRPPWLAWVGHDEQLRLLPLDEAGAPSGLPSSEDSLSDARPLAIWASTSGAPARWLLATPSDPAGPLRAVACTLAKGL
jgi:hypothetical protein